MQKQSVTRRLLRAMCACLSLAVASALFTSVAAAQFDILERALSRIEGVSLFYQMGGLSPGSPGITTSRLPGVEKSSGVSGFGVEMFISLGSIAGSREPTEAECAEERALVGDADTVEIYTETRNVDDRRTATTVVRTKPRADFCRPADFAALQLALGYSQLRGIRSTDADLDVRGSITESPAVALYMAFRPDAALSPYVGLRAGRADMQALRAYDSNAVIYDGTASTLQAGLSAGVSLTLLEVFELVVEPAYVWRTFPSVEWRVVSGSSEGMLPPALPRALNVGGWVVSFGLDFSLPTGK